MKISIITISVSIAISCTTVSADDNMYRYQSMECRIDQQITRIIVPMYKDLKKNEKEKLAHQICDLIAHK